MFTLRQSPTARAGRSGPRRPSRLLRVACLIFSLLALPVSAAESGCPDLQPYYPDGEETDWLMLERELARLMPRCLRNAEFFALYGAAQLNSGQLGAATESLERALLIDPEHGAARVDYAQALFLQGQLFPALEMNRRLLERPDVPEDLAGMLRRRQQQWQERTTRTDVQLDLLAGHDSNLNSGPSAREITLTLSGEPIDLTLSPDFRAIRGAYSNLRLATSHTRFQPGSSHNWLAELNGRVSEDPNSDITQLNTRYAWVRPQRDHSWHLGGGLSHLLVGGDSLFTATEANLRYQVENGNGCAPFYSLTAQHQFYHRDNSELDALEARNTAGLSCGSDGRNLTAEFSGLNSLATSAGRPGGDRLGWQARLNWQYRLTGGPGGVLGGQLSHTRLEDDEAYSELLADGARRQLRRSYVLLQYRRPLPVPGTLLLNVYHQRQRSNIELFTRDETAVEAGIRINF